jgi:two-component system OmpR family sensor kinase
VLAVTIGGCGFALWRMSRNAEIRQLDQRMELVLPAVRGIIDRSGGNRPPPSAGVGTGAAAGNGALDAQNAGSTGDNPLSDIYVASIGSDGTRTLIVPSRETTLAPQATSTVASPDFFGAHRYQTVGSVGGSLSWRATMVKGAAGSTFLIAVSQHAVDQTSTRLITALVLTGAVILGVLALAGWWVVRLGLRPITRIAATATAITAGDRDLRVPVTSASRTEAAHLANALNVMLDEHRADEAQLRRFVSDASHELRTPVASIRGFTDLYRRGALEEPGQLEDAMRRIGAEGARMAALVDDLLLLARLDEGQPLASGRVDIGAVLRDAALDASATHPSRTVTVDAADGLVVLGDEHRLRQVVANLLTNALVHGGSSPVLLSASQSGRNICSIVVVDTGPGMPTQDAAKAFDRFWRADAARQRNGTGSGLGLSIVRAIVESHGGSTAIDSRPGSGTTVTVRIPLAPDSSSA